MVINGDRLGETDKKRKGRRRSQEAGKNRGSVMQMRARRDRTGKSENGRPKEVGQEGNVSLSFIKRRHRPRVLGKQATWINNAE